MARSQRQLLQVVLMALALAGAAEGAAPPGPLTDLYGDTLPPGAILRLGTSRLRAANGWKVFAIRAPRCGWHWSARNDSWGWQRCCRWCWHRLQSHWPHGDFRNGNWMARR